MQRPLGDAPLLRAALSDAQHYTRSCHPCGGSMRYVVPAAAHDEIDAPSQVDSWYLPDQRLLVVDLDSGRGPSETGPAPQPDS